MVGAGGVDAAGRLLDGGDGRLLVGGDQVQVAGVVVACLAAGGAVGARGAEAGSPVGDRVFERLQVLEPAPVNGASVCCGSGVGVWIARDGVGHGQCSAGGGGWWCGAIRRAAPTGSRASWMA